MTQCIYDPQGFVEVLSKQLSKRVATIDGLRLAVLDNTKWNASRLLDSVTDLLSESNKFAKITRYQKETFTKPAAPELVRDIAANNDIAVIAIAD
jgi:hypothetical protein